ncbi:MAG: hypothetical protein KY428_09680, partial [Bacteroidetes bacterium]|nr:hypothetical protein [Bacteroidota bacterium]
KDPELAKMVEDWSDTDIWTLNRGGHDPKKVYAAYAEAASHKGQPTVILAKTIKGYGMGEAGEGQNITPARFARTPEENQRISAEVRRQLENVARIANIEGYARIDAFVRVYEDGRVETVIIEINSLPGMTPATCIFHQSALNGYKPYEFIDAILTYGIERKRLRPTV